MRKTLICWALVALALPAAAQITLNTSLTAFVPLTGSPWVADVTGYVDGSGNEYALVCLGSNGLAVVDVTNPLTASVVSTIAATGSDLKDVRVYQNWAYCVQQNGAIIIVDLSVPTAATVAGTIPIPGSHNAFVDVGRGLLYISFSGNSGSPMNIYDVAANPTSPPLLFSYDPPGHNSHDAWADGNRAYSFDIQSHLTHVLDVTNPSSPITLTTLAEGNHSGWGYTPTGDSSLILVNANEQSAGHINIYDVTDGTPSNPLATYFTDPQLSVHNVVVHGRYAYIAYYKDGLRILDLANPANPVEVGIWDPTPVNVGGSLFQGTWGVWPFSETKIIISEMFGSQGINIIEFTPPPRVDLKTSTTGAGDFSMIVSELDPGGVTYLAASADTSNLFGTGPFLGLGGDAIFNVQIPFQPFVGSANGAGVFSFFLPAGIPPGGSADMASISFKSAVGTFVVSNLGRITF